MGFKEDYYPESKFGGFSDIDGTKNFYTRVQALATPESVVIDYGAGRGSYREQLQSIMRELRTLHGRVKRVIGLDVDEALAENPFLDEYHVFDGAKWPLPDNTADLCVCDFVMEHLPDPEMFFAEARRVLKDGGYLCVRTPNRWGYVALAAQLIPNRKHAQVVSQVQENRKAVDVFPTLYRCNSIGKMRRALERYGFDHAVYGYEAEPAYFSFSRVAYRLGMIYHRLTPNRWRTTIFAFAQLHKTGRDAG
jgi:SAM-dependent methyltransferase